jgi:hypothetical protein
MSWLASTIEKYLNKSRLDTQKYLQLQAALLEDATERHLLRLLVDGMKLSDSIPVSNQILVYKLAQMKLACKYKAFVCECSGIELVPWENQAHAFVKILSYQKDLMDGTLCTKDNPTLASADGRQRVLTSIVGHIKRCILLNVETNMEVVPLFPCNVNEPRLLHFVSPVLSKVLQGVERVLPIGAKDGRIRLPLYIPAYHAQLPQASLQDGIAELYNSWIEGPTYTVAPITVEVDVQGTTLYLDPVSLGIVARLVLFCVLKYGSLNIFTRLRVDVELMFKYAIQPVTANERIMELVAFQLTRGELNPWVFLPGAYANKQLATLLNAVTKTTSAFFAKPIAADTSDQESDSEEEPEKTEDNRQQTTEKPTLVEEKKQQSKDTTARVISRVPVVAYSYLVRITDLNGAHRLLSVHDDEVESSAPVARDAIKKYCKYLLT